ncbi:MAG: hypothetical protein CVV52_08980 [Spirochaetae bacterium HGW-Spirochaetae-8]|nr:MAG: hypothetical protein CVV52_08980 [Spirochaetae bacterium HGW-Spirochaetae-8]
MALHRLLRVASEVVDNWQKLRDGKQVKDTFFSLRARLLAPGDFNVTLKVNVIWGHRLMG